MYSGVIKEVREAKNVDLQLQKLKMSDEPIIDLNIGQFDLTPEQQANVAAFLADNPSAFVPTDNMDASFRDYILEDLPPEVRDNYLAMHGDDEEVDSAQMGGYVTREGLVNLHAGEIVLPQDVTRRFMEQMTPMETVELLNATQAAMPPESEAPVVNTPSEMKVKTDINLAMVEKLLKEIRDENRKASKRSPLLSKAEDLAY